MSPQLRVALVVLMVVGITWLLVVTGPAIAALLRSAIAVTKRQLRASWSILEPEFPKPDPPDEKPDGDTEPTPGTDKGENHRDVPRAQFL
jgi:hypothetical protein